MVRNLDNLDFHLPSHAQDMLDGLQRLRSLPKLADVTLLVGNKELPCHRSLLALSSPYFHAMFAGDFAESFSARVELRDVEPVAVAQLVDFVYTGRLTITQNNVEVLTRTASRLHFPTVQKVCGRYLQQQLDATNCLGICEFGEQQGLLGVAAKAWAFLRENFEAVAQEDEFLQLPRDRLATCLASDLLQVQPEQSRLEALLRWVRHDPEDRSAHLPKLLSLVHLDAVPRPCVQQLLATEPLIQESEACQEVLSQGHSGVSEGQGTSSQGVEEEPRIPTCMGRKEWAPSKCPTEYGSLLRLVLRESITIHLSSVPRSEYQGKNLALSLPLRSLPLSEDESKYRSNAQWKGQHWGDSRASWQGQTVRKNSLKESASDLGTRCTGGKHRSWMGG